MSEIKFSVTAQRKLIAAFLRDCVKDQRALNITMGLLDAVEEIAVARYGNACQEQRAAAYLGTACDAQVRLDTLVRLIGEPCTTKT